jgi:hypothetical protein
VQVAEEISTMPPDLALALFRASEFALQRMLREAPPKHVELIAELEEGRLLLTLQATGLSAGPPVQTLAIENFQHWLGRYAGSLTWEDEGGGSAKLSATAPVSGFSAGEGPSGSRSTPTAH